ncbi:MAG: RloB domain-containing protein [Hyphomonadaceae bacterium]|nr:RloB domain-containing protein [Clostridia bacterium]
MRPNNNWKRPRKTFEIEPIEHKYYIFCEGEQTEPLYFNGLKTLIESNVIYKNLVLIDVKGIGLEAIQVIMNAKEYVDRNKISNAQIWCVYDKDNLSAERFNSASELARELSHIRQDIRYHVAWSNQCIEYWFMLHFDYYDSNNDRDYYKKYLHGKFKALGWNRYEKTNSELFNILLNKGNPKMAIKYAEKRLLECSEQTDSNSAPATMVHLLVSELAKYLPEAAKNKIL